MLAAWTSISAAWAEVLVILPQSGHMARAGNSVKAGIEAAHQAYADQIALKFIDSQTHSLKEALAQVTAKTRLVIGPLDRQRVEQWVKQDLAIPRLTLNHIQQQKKGVYQFALSKEEDAIALTARMQADGVKHVYVLQQAQTQAETQSTLAALKQQWATQLQLVKQLPKHLTPQDAVFFLGSQHWLNQHIELLKETQPNLQAHVYASAYSVDEIQQFPIGVTLCDASSLYNQRWEELSALKQQEAHAAYLRLMAFGADAWHIARRILSDADHSTVFAARTGDIQIANKIIRTPKCMLRQPQGWMEYP